MDSVENASKCDKFYYIIFLGQHFHLLYQHYIKYF